MYRGTKGLVTAVAIIIIIGCSVLSAGEQNSQMLQPSGSTIGTQNTLQEYTAIQSNQENFSRARESFLKEDYKDAAADIRKSIKFMKSQESNASADGKKLLKSSVKELTKLAKDVEKGKVTTVQTLDNAFSRAKNAINRNRQMKTMESDTKGAAARTGQAIKDAPSNLKHGLSWTGGKIGDAASIVVKDTGFIAGKIIEGGGWVGKQTGNAINSIGVKVQNFGRNIQPKKQETMTQ